MQQSRVRKVSAVALLMAAAAAAGGYANETEGPEGVQARVGGELTFVEIAGEMEFSGEVIAKPLQFEELADRGYSQDRITQTISQAKALLSQYNEVWYEALVDHHIITVPAGKTENQFINDLMKTGLFEFVEPNWILYPIGCPNDQRFAQQWHHQNNRMQSCLAWDIHTGSPSTTIGSCDTGVDLDHPDLLQHRVEGYNAPNRRWENNGGAVNDINGHGTHVTGCSGANGNNTTGVSGVGWNFSHRMLRVTNSSGGSASLGNLTHAALTSIQAGDKVANVSYSGVTSSSVRSTGTQIKNLGGLLCWAAGNNGANLNWGNRDNDDVIVVGSTTSSDSKSGFSAFGPSVDLMAPGSSILSTTNGGGYQNFSGTSMASPVCAGVIALIWDYNPSLTPDEVEDILKQGCDDLGSNGVDNTFGYGRVNPYESLLLAGGSPNEPPVLTVHSPLNNSTYELGDTVTFDSTATDPEDGDISGQVTWTDAVDGLLGTGDFSMTADDLGLGIHFIEVEIVDGGGLTDWELIQVTVEEGGGGTIPDAPESRHAREQTPPGKLWFKWFDESDNETGFEIQREEIIGGSWTNRQTVATVGPNSTAWSENLTQGGYRYRNRALGDGGNSPWSAWRHSKPYRILSSNSTVAGGDVTLTWDEESELENGFVIERRQRVDGVWTDFQVIATLPTNTEAYVDTPGSGRFRYRVQGTSDALRTWYRYFPIVDVP